MNKRILKKCLQIARSNLTKHNEPYRHFTFIVIKNIIIEWGTNRRGEPLTFLGYDKHTKIHSEVDAYFKGKGLMGKEPFEAINIRLAKNGELKNSRPCRCCTQFLKGFKCKRIWFTTHLDGFARIDL